MRKTRVFSIITICIATILIVTGYSMIFINDYVVDAEEKNTYSSMIKTSFNSYSIDLETISYQIKSSNIFSMKYYDDVKNTYNLNIDSLNNIGQLLKETETTSKDLLYECDMKEYNDYEIDYKCSTIAYNYESVVNAYVSLTEKYNLKINEYNKWTENQNDLNQNKLNEYKSDYYKEYVDINMDGEYSGIIK